MSSGEAHREGVSDAFALSAYCAWVLCGVASYGYIVTVSEENVATLGV